MTDSTSDLDRAERIRRLQARRSATRRPSAPSSRQSKRHHPAAASRWTLAGLSIASFFTIAGAVAVADQTPGSPRPVTSGATAALPDVAALPGAIPAPASTTRTVAARPHTTTRGS